MNEEKMRVLRMIQEGKLTPEEGLQLLEALDEPITPEAGKSTRVETTPAPRTGGRWFHVRVTDLDTGKVRTNVRIPLSIVSMGIKMGARFAPQVEGLEIEHLSEFINDGVTGQIVDVTDDEDGEHVEVYIE